MNNKIRAIASAVALLLAADALATPTELSVGLHFGTDYTNAVLAPTATAGVPGVTQANWNNLGGRTGNNGTNTVWGDIGGSPVATSVGVSYTTHLSNATTGAGKENNGFPTNSADRALMTGYLDSGTSATTTVTINNVPAALASQGYDVYVYGLGNVGGNGGAYRITDGNGNLLLTSGGGSTDYQTLISPTNAATYSLPTSAGVGDYIVFHGLIGNTTFVVEATTANSKGVGSAASAAVNAVQLVANPAPAQLLIGGVSGNAFGFSIAVREVGGALADTNTIALTLNGTAVTATGVTKDAVNSIWTISYTASAPLGSGAAEAVVLTIKDKNANSYNATRNFTAPSYSTVISPSLALPSSVSSNPRGFLLRTYQVEATPGNSDLIAEAILAGVYGPNVANPAGVQFDGFFHWTNVINFDIATNSSDGEFNAPAYQDFLFPGIPGFATSHNTNEDFAVEAWTAIQFPAAGVYTLNVNSDDGFRTYCGVNLMDLFSGVGQFDGGRGASDSFYSFVITQPGIYPFRTVYEQGGGGGNFEWSSRDATGALALLNDSKTNIALKTYQYKPSVLPPHIVQVSPGRNATSLGSPGVISALIADGTTVLQPNSVTMKINGTSVTPRVTKSGIVSTISFAPAPPLPNGSAITIDLSFSDDQPSPYQESVEWTFNTGTQIPNGSFVIEAEDFNYGAGQNNPKAGTAGLDVNNFPYNGGAYDQLGAVSGIDYSNNDSQESVVYRNKGDLLTAGKGVSITGNLGSRLGADRGSYNLTTNYRIGWVDNNEWYNYTRNIPGGVYAVSFAMSSGSSGDNMGATLGLVTSNPATNNQSVVSLGTGRQTMDGAGWGNSILFPAKNSDGSLAVFPLAGGTTTLRVTTIEGDFDFFVLVPQSNVQPKFLGGPIDSIRRDGKLSLDIENLSTAVNTNTIHLLVDGTDVTAQSAIVNTIIGVNVSYTKNLFDRGSHTFGLNFSDNSATPQSQSLSGTFQVNPYPTPGIFVIEAEDFDYNGGKWNPLLGSDTQDVDQMPYFGGAYNGLGAVYGVDYSNNDNQDNKSNGVPLYRNGPTNIVNDLYTKGKGANIGSNNGGRYGKDRGVWTMNVNYSIGWGDAGDWANYTRTFPTNKYEVWVATSHDGRGTHGVVGKFSLITAGAGSSTQTVADVGGIDYPSTGGWGNDDLFPIKDANGVVQVVTLGGVATTRYTVTSGDFDYLVFVPTAAIAVVPPTIVAQPAAVAGITGTSFGLHVGAHGTGPFTYQWYKNFVPISGATGSSITINAAKSSDAGSYRVIVSNSAGTAYSDVINVTVTPYPPGLSLALYAGLTITGSIGGTYTVQYATNLTAPITWNNAATVTLTGNSLFWVDPDSPKNPNRYYRAIASP